eukprot:7920215-Karenia_brevis.AAC.1
MVPTFPPGPQWIHIGDTEGKGSRPDELDMWYGTAKDYHRPGQQSRHRPIHTYMQKYLHAREGTLNVPRLSQK